MMSTAAVRGLGAAIFKEVLLPPCSRGRASWSRGTCSGLTLRWTNLFYEGHNQNQQQQQHRRSNVRSFSNETKPSPPNEFTPFSEKNINKVVFNEKEDTSTLNIDRSKFTEVVEVKMPDMGDGEGKIVKWYKKEGDIVQYADLLCDIQTKEFTFGMEIDDEEPGILDKVFFDAPSGPLKDNEVICILLHEAKGSAEKAKKEKAKEDKTKPEQEA